MVEPTWHPTCSTSPLAKGLRTDRVTVEEPPGSLVHDCMTQPAGRGGRYIIARADSKVGDVMTRDPLVVGPDMSLRTAQSLMREKGIRHLPVVEESGRLLGILTDRDLRHAAFVPALMEYIAWDSRRLKSPRVSDVMTWSVVTTHPDATLGQAGLTMFQRRIGSLPVVEQGRLVGILTDTDLLRAMGSIEAPPEA